MGLILNQLTNKFNSGSTKIIKENSFETDPLTIAINDVSTKYASTDYGQASSQDYLSLFALSTGEYEGHSYDAKIHESMSIEQFLAAFQGEISADVVKNITEFITTSSKENASIPSVLWATVINNSIKNKTENNNEIIKMFTYTLENFGEIALEDLTLETLSILENTPLSREYFNSAFITTEIDSDAWYDFKKYPIDQFEDMVYDLKINNVEELLELIKDIKNLPSAIEYIKREFIPSYGNELELEYKALSILTNIYNSKEFKEDSDFDKDNNIGFNLSLKLMKTESLLKKNQIEVENTDRIKNIKGAAKLIVSNKIFKKESNPYKMLGAKVSSFVTRYGSVTEKVKDGSFTPSVRKDLVKLGLIKKGALERDLIKNTTYILEALKNKVGDANRLIDYLKHPKKMDKLKNDPFIDDASELYEEINNWITYLKTQNIDKGLVLASIENMNICKEYIYQPTTKLEQVSTNPKTSVSQSTTTITNEATQLSIEL